MPEISYSVAPVRLLDLHPPHGDFRAEILEGLAAQGVEDVQVEVVVFGPGLPFLALLELPDQSTDPGLEIVGLASAPAGYYDTVDETNAAGSVWSSRSAPATSARLSANSGI